MVAALRRSMWELRGLRLQDAIVDKKLALEVRTAVNAADVCTKALPGDRMRQLCRFGYVFLCHSEDTMRVDLENSSLSQLDDRSSGGELCHQKFFEQPNESESEGTL